MIGRLCAPLPSRLAVSIATAVGIGSGGQAGAGLLGVMPLQWPHPASNGGSGAGAAVAEGGRAGCATWCRLLCSAGGRCLHTLAPLLYGFWVWA